MSTSPNFFWVVFFNPYSIVKDRHGTPRRVGDWVEQGVFTPERPLQPDEPD